MKDESLINIPDAVSSTPETKPVDSAFVLGGEPVAEQNPASPTTLSTSENQPVDYQKIDPAALSDAPKTDYSGGLLTRSVNDINTLSSQENNLMRGVETKAKQEANSRGLLNSSMAIGAAENARLNAVLPLVQQNAGVRGNIAVNEQSQEFSAEQASLDRKQQLDVLVEDTNARAYLIDVEQEWNQSMTNNALMADYWTTQMDAIGRAFSSGLTTEQSNSMLDYYLGEENSITKKRSGGQLNAGLTFMDNLSGDWSAPSSEESVLNSLPTVNDWAPLAGIGSGLLTPLNY